MISNVGAGKRDRKKYRMTGECISKGIGHSLLGELVEQFAKIRRSIRGENISKPPVR